MFFLYFFLFALLASAQVIDGVQVNELAVPTYQNEDVLGVFNNSSNETFVVLKRDNGGGRILYKKGSTAFTDIDLSGIKGALWTPTFLDGQNTILESFVVSPDGLYFTTMSPVASICGSFPTGGSYRIRNGKVETLAFGGQEIDFKGLDGVTKKATAYCFAVGSPSETGDALMWIRPAIAGIGVLDGYIAKKQGKLFTALFQMTLIDQPAGYLYSYVTGIPLPGLNVWEDKSDIYFSKNDLGRKTLFISSFNLETKKFTDVYNIGATENVWPAQFWSSYANNPSTGERYLKIVKGGIHSVVAVSKTNSEQLFVIPTTFSEFQKTGVSLRNTMSRQMALFGVVPDKTFEGIGVWKGDGSRSEVLLQKGQTLPSGRVIKNLHNPALNTALFSTSNCTSVVPTYQVDSAKLDVLLEIKTPCVTEYPKVSIEGSMVTLKGFDFTLGSTDKIEVSFGASGKTQALNVNTNSLTFLAPAGCNDPCDVQIVSGKFTSNIVRIKFERGPISQPEIKAITDLNGVVGSASPGKLMTLYGLNGCSVVTPIPLITPFPVVVNGVLRDDSVNGCKVLVDGTAVGLYFAWTGPDGSSQLNFLVPYGITEGNHELVLQKTELRNGVFNVIATSKPFVFKVESVNPTFFKPYNYDITLSAPPYAEDGQPVYVSPTHPAHPGDVLVAYLSGGGKTSPMLPERNAGTAQFLQTVEIWINNVPCTVLYAGTQNQYPGLEQINFQLPNVSSEGGSVTLKIKVGNSVKEFKLNFD